MSEGTNVGLDLGKVEVPPERILKDKFEIPLKDGEFLFNAGHSAIVYKLGIVNHKNLYKVSGENAIWAKIDVKDVVKSQVFTRKPDLVLQKLTEMFGEELRQTSAATDRENLKDMKDKLLSPDLTQQKRQTGESFVLRLEGRLQKVEDRQEHQARSVDLFMNQVAQTGRDVTQIPKYDSTIAVVNKTLGRS